MIFLKKHTRNGLSQSPTNHYVFFSLTHYFLKCNDSFIILIEVTEYPSTFTEKICVRIATGTGVTSVENDIGMETNQLHVRRTNKSACKDNKMTLSQENTSLKPNQNP